MVEQIRLVNSRFLMRLADVNQEDIGYYTCVVSNEFGQLNWTRNLDVIGQSRCTLSDVLLYCTVAPVINVLLGVRY